VKVRENETMNRINFWKMSAALLLIAGAYATSLLLMLNYIGLSM